jgi:Fe-S-cluster-containing dehydrogenase component
MAQNIFHFNLNKCVGCHACVVACSIENKTLPGPQWREITSVNPMVYPGIPLFHYSLACNHCLDAPCMHNCPALAYSRDKNTGAIIHHPEKCIGCKYCTWACPYDAPKYNAKKGIIEKCTFCNHRIAESLKPSCANLCPTGALDFIDSPEISDNTGIPGFTEIGIRPSIKIVAPATGKPKLVVSEPPYFTLPNTRKKTRSKINVKHEWPLALFTLIAMLMVSYFTAGIFNKLTLNPILFLISGIVAMGLSSFHLGKKQRAWRAVFNLKNSWLSREIFFFMIFFGLGTGYLFHSPEEIMAQAAIVSGVLALFSIDKVYKLAVQPIKLEIHSAHVLLGFFLFAALFLENYYAFLLIVAIKTGLYIYRKLEMKKMGKKVRLFASAWRLDMLLSFPFIFWFFDFSYLQWWVFGSVLIGELIDRAEYYDELDIITPGKQIEKDF